MGINYPQIFNATYEIGHVRWDHKLKVSIMDSQRYMVCYYAPVNILLRLGWQAFAWKLRTLTVPVTRICQTTVRIVIEDP